METPSTTLQTNQIVLFHSNDVLHGNNDDLIKKANEIVNEESKDNMETDVSNETCMPIITSIISLFQGHEENDKLKPESEIKDNCIDTVIETNTSTNVNNTVSLNEDVNNIKVENSNILPTDDICVNNIDSTINSDKIKNEVTDESLNKIDINIFPNKMCTDEELRVVKICKAGSEEQKVLVDLDIKNEEEFIVGEDLKECKLQYIQENTDDLLAPLGFQCSICLKSYQTLKALYRHETNHKSDEKELNHNIDDFENDDTDQKPSLNGLYSCTCGKNFRRKLCYTMCLKSHRVTKYTCQLCSQVFSSLVELKKHKRTEHADFSKPCGYCKICDRTFIYKSSFEKHKRSHGDDNPPPAKTDEIISYECTECKLKFRRKEALECHSKLHHHNLPTTFTYTPIKNKNVPLNNTAVKNKNVPLNNTAVKNKNLPLYNSAVNIKNETTFNNITVKNKNISTFNNTNIKNKNITTFNNTTVKNNNTTFNNTIKNNIPSSMKRKFPCNICTRSFFTFKTLTQHRADVHKNVELENNIQNIKTEMDEKCNYCNLSFKNDYELQLHNHLSHKGRGIQINNNLFKCDVCDRLFRSKKIMMLHKGKHPFVRLVNDSGNQVIFFK